MLRAMTRAIGIGIVIMLAAACSGSTGSKPAIDATPHGFPCGNAVCGEGTQFCYRFASGVAPASPGCNDLPQACLASPSCGCVMSNITTACGAFATCSAQGADLTVTCNNP